MKYLLIETFCPDHYFVLGESPNSQKPLILDCDFKEAKKYAKKYCTKGIVVPLTYDLMDLLYTCHNFINNIKGECEENIDIGESGIENGDDCLETRIGDLLY